MEITFLFKGFILGFSVAAPVGPIGILCINRTLNKGYGSGFVTGLGAATADLIYGLIAGLGLTVISDFLLEYKLWIQLVGLMFLMYLGVKTLFKHTNRTKPAATESQGLIKDYLTTFILTITNPMTILFFIAVFAGLGLSTARHGKLDTIPLVLGVLAGSGIWWMFLSGLTYKIRNRLGDRILQRIDCISGAIMIIFGIIMTINLIKGIK